MVSYITSLVWRERITNSIPLGILGPFNLVCFRGGFPLHVCFSSCPHHTDVSNPRIYCDVNRCNADASLFDRLQSLWVFIYPPSPFCSHANCGRCRRSLDTYSTRREQTANSDPNRKFSAPFPPDRVEVEIAHVFRGLSPNQDGPIRIA